MQYLTITFIFLFVSACSPTTKIYTAYSDWDSNNDGKVQRGEFVEGYIHSDYFDKWGKGSSSISYDDLYSNMFKTLDQDGDARLTREEFNAQIKLFYFGLFSMSLDQWDVTKDSMLDQNEFVANASKSNLPTLWDTNSDKRISKNELAGGMFYLADANSDGAVDVSELNAWKSAR